MMRSPLLWLLVLGLWAGSLPDSRAQVAIEVGPRLGLDASGDIEELFIGAEARVHLPTLPVLLAPSFDLYLVDGPVDFFQLGLNVLYPLRTPTLDLYVGGGLGINRLSVDTDNPRDFFWERSDTSVGLNLIGGAVFQAGTLKPFAQAQISLGEVDLFTLAGGLLFKIGN